MPVTRAELTLMLQSIIRDEERRREHIRHFQALVWRQADADFDLETSLLEFLRELALDLDYYESDEQERRTDWVFYGEEVLLSLVQHALERLEPDKS